MSNPGGFVEACSSTATRPRPTVALPERGPFRFPEPYGTTGIRLTNASDMGGQDALNYVGYSYWRRINNHQGQPTLVVFLCLDRLRGGTGPSLYRVHKGTDDVFPLGPILPSDHPLMWSTGETWYWSACHPDLLYASDLEHLYRINVVTKAVETVIDITPYRGLGKVLWQFHSADDDRTHSATWKDATTYQPQGCIVYREGCGNPWIGVYPAKGDLDECQISKCGAWLLIKENLDGQAGEDNRLICVDTGAERVLLDQQGAAGHSDNGYGYMVAADNWNDKPNAIRLWAFREDQEPQGRVIYYSPTWDIEVNHVSHANARPGSPDGQWVLGSGATDAVGPRANELMMIPLDGSLRVLVIAPNLTAPGAGYDDLPKASLDPSGEYAIWTANGHGRRDAFLVKVPGHRLG